MISLYFLSSTIIQQFLVLSIILVVLQSIVVALVCFYSTTRNIGALVHEIFILAYIAIIATLPSSIITNGRYGIVDVNNYTIFLPSIAIPIILLSVILFIKERKIHIITSTSIIFSLPFISNSLYCYSYSLFFIMFIIRTVLTINESQHRRYNEITSFSIREGLDNLRAGIMFFDTDGYIYLSNTFIYDIMLRFFNKEFKNGNIFWQSLSNLKLNNADIYNIQEDIVVRTTANTLRFSKKSITINKKEYTELIATDVTDIDKNFLKLEKNEKELLMQEDEIRLLSGSMIKLREEQEYARMQSQIHDIMGQRLSAIQRMLQTKEHAMYKNIIPLLQDIVENIKEEYKPTVEQNYYELKKYFQQIGTDIEESGSFPESAEVARIFFEIIREATTNATRHANATIVSVDMYSGDKQWEMKITNNGNPPKESIVEGVGLSGIRKRVENINGMIYIITKPRFSIKVSIQKKQENI